MKNIVTCLIICFSFSGKAHSSSNDKPYTCSSLRTQHPQFDGNLIQALVFLEHQNQCPMVAEVTKPFPLSLHIDAGFRNLSDDLASLRPQLAEYSLTEQIGVISIRELKLQRSPNNPMNQMIPLYYMPETLNYLRQTLPDKIKLAATGLGGLPGGLGVPPQHDSSLKPATLYDITGHEILIRAFSDIGSGFSLIIFKDDRPVKNASDNLMDWTLLAGPSVKTIEIKRADLGMR